MLRFLLIILLGCVIFASVRGQELPAASGEESVAAVPSSVSWAEKTPEALKSLELSQEFNWRTDWWKYLIMTLGALAACFLVLRLCNMVFRLAIFLFCVSVGIVGGLLLQPYLRELLEPILPEVMTQYITLPRVAYGLGFVCCYVAVALLVNLLPQRVREAVPKDGRK